MSESYDFFDEKLIQKIHTFFEKPASELGTKEFAYINKIK